MWCRHDDQEIPFAAQFDSTGRGMDWECWAIVVVSLHCETCNLWQLGAGLYESSGFCTVTMLCSTTKHASHPLATPTNNVAHLPARPATHAH